MPMKRQFYSLEGEIQAECEGTTVREYHRDALGSVVATAVDGAVENTRFYKPYGELLHRAGLTADSRFGWVGSHGYLSTARAYSDAYVRARHYATAIGRWSTVDPLWPLEPQFNYVTANPGGSEDPTGLQGGQPPQKPIWPFPMGAGFPDVMPKLQRIAVGVACADCAMNIAAKWLPTTNHFCHHAYTHCVACCVLAALYGEKCAIAAQTAQPGLKPKRMEYCKYGIGGGGLGVGDSNMDKCHAHCTHKYGTANTERPCKWIKRVPTAYPDPC